MDIASALPLVGCSRRGCTMPIVDVEIVGEFPVEAAVLSPRLADALAQALGSGVGQTWVRLRKLPDICYAENAAGDAGARPVFVTIIKRERGDAADEVAEARRVCAAVATVSGRAEDLVHVIYEPPGKGRIAFGGRLIR